MTRIIAGTARGRRLAAPKGTSTRPTSEKVRGAIFNVLGQFFDGGEALDLYAGTGALALEALSRGCARAVCVEADRRAADLIGRNAQTCGFEARLEILRSPVDAALARLASGRFALVLIDPPYAEGPEAALALVGRVTAAGGRVVAEHDARRPPADEYEALRLVDRRSWGATGVSIYLRG